MVRAFAGRVIILVDRGFIDKGARADHDCGRGLRTAYGRLFAIREMRRTKRANPS